MDQLPTSLLYYTSAISNFTRNTVKLNTLNTDNLKTDGATQLRLALPTNAICNMKSLSMRCRMITKGQAASGAGGADNNAVYALIPKGGPNAVIDRLTFSSGGQSLDNGATPYHVLYALRQNLKKGTQKAMSDDKVLEQSCIEPYTAPQEIANNENGQTKDFIVNHFLGFPEMLPQYLDLSLLPEVFMTLQISDASVIPIQYEGTELGQRTPAVTPSPAWTGTAAKFELADISFTLEVCTIGSGMYDMITQRLLLERSSIDIPYPQYQVFSGTETTAGGSIRGSVSCMSLDRIHAVQRNAGTPGAAPGGDGAPYDAYWLQQPPVPVSGSTSFAFQNAADNFISKGISQYQFQLNNAPFPTFKPTRLDAFNFAVCGDDRTYSNMRGGLVSSQSMWYDNCWTAVQRLCFDEDLRRLSGVNLSSINSQIIFQAFSDNVAANNWKRQFMLITEQTSLLRVGQSRAIAVVA